MAGNIKNYPKKTSIDQALGYGKSPPQALDLEEAVLGAIMLEKDAIIDMAWQIYMSSSKENADCTVLIDEVENHLHPSMQRQILSDLVSAFPQAKFIVSTHSPLVVGSVRDSKIFALTYDEKNKIISRKLDFERKAKTAAEVLDEVLGVSVTMPVWAEEQLKTAVPSRKYQVH